MLVSICHPTFEYEFIAPNTCVKFHILGFHAVISILGPTLCDFGRYTLNFLTVGFRGFVIHGVLQSLQLIKSSSWRYIPQYLALYM
jgi:hypothetical protein